MRSVQTTMATITLYNNSVNTAVNNSDSTVDFHITGCSRKIVCLFLTLASVSNTCHVMLNHERWHYLSKVRSKKTTKDMSRKDIFSS